MSLDDETARLYQGALPAFISERQKLAADLKRAGRSAELAIVKALAKPSRTAWAVNQVYWHAREAFDAVVVAGEQLRAAQHARLGGNTEASVVRTLGARDRVIEAAVRAAEAQARAQGERLPPDLRQRVRITFEALAARPLHELPVRPGRLVDDLGPSGFEAMVALVPSGGFGDRMPTPPATEETEGATGRAKLRLVETSARVESARAAARRQARAAALAEARVEAERTARALEAARAAADAAAQAVAEARKTLALREQQVADAHRARETAARDLGRAEADVADAAQSLEQAARCHNASMHLVVERQSLIDDGGGH